MSIEAQQLVVLMLFAALLVVVNIKSGMWWLDWLTLLGTLACLGAAGYLVVEWVFL